MTLMNPDAIPSREIVSRAIHFRKPPRLPVMMSCFGVDDTAWVGCKSPAGWKPADRTDEWGWVWDKTDLENMGQVKFHPLADIREMGERYAGRIAFQSLSDIQASLPTGDRGRVAEDAAQLMRHWARPEGGFIFSDYGSDAAIGVKDAGIKRFMYETFSRDSRATRSWR
jgi:hypothetical protein